MKHWKRYGLMIQIAIWIAILEVGIYVEAKEVELDPFLEANLALLCMVAVIGFVFSLTTLVVDWDAL